MSEEVWPEPIGMEVESALAAFEAIRSRAMAISQWTLNERVANSYHAKVQQGLRSAGVRLEASQAVAREQIRLLRLLDDAALQMASAARLAAEKLESDFVGPIRDWQSDQSGDQRLGLRVNR